MAQRGQDAGDGAAIDHQSEDTRTIDPEEVLEQLLVELRAYTGVVGAWAEMLTGEIFIPADYPAAPRVAAAVSGIK